MNWTRSHAAYFQVWSFARIILLAGLIEVLYNVGTTVLSGQELPTLFSWNILCNSLAPTPALLVRFQVKNYLNWFPNSAMFKLLCLLYSYGQRKLRLISGSRNWQKKIDAQKRRTQIDPKCFHSPWVWYLPNKKESQIQRQSLFSRDMLTWTKNMWYSYFLFLNTGTFWGLRISHSKMHKFATKITHDKIA